MFGKSLSFPRIQKFCSNQVQSINQVAARACPMVASNPHPTHSANRPRLAASLLCTGSQTSLSTKTPLSNLVAVNALFIRSTLLGALFACPLNSNNGSINGDVLTAAGLDESLTTERVESFVQEPPS